MKKTDMQVDILAFGAHPDDVELGCGGTLVSHVKQGLKVGIVDLTRGELGTRGSAALRMKEASASASALGVSFRENLDLGDGFFEITKSTKIPVVRAIRKYRPQLVLANAVEDRHPDHGRAALLVQEAVFLAGLSKVDISDEEGKLPAWQTPAVYHYIQDRYHKPDVIVDISDYLDEKFEAILSFKSQFYNRESTEPETPISTPEFLEMVKNRCIEFGRMAGVKYGEGFTSTRPPAVRSLTHLL